MRRKLRGLAAVVVGAMLLAAGTARAQIVVVIDDFENIPAAPWGVGYGMKISSAAEGHTGKSAEVLIRPSGESLGMLKALDVPQKMTRMTLWVKGTDANGMNIQPAFKDRQGFQWYGTQQSVSFSGWKQLEFDVRPDKLQTDWRLAWWKKNFEEQASRRRANQPAPTAPMEFAQTAPLRFTGFKVGGPNNAEGTILMDDLAIEASDAGTYVHLPRGTLRVPQDGTFPLIVAAGAEAASGRLTLRVVSRNDQPLNEAPITIPVNVPAGGRNVFDAPLKLTGSGIYKIEISGVGIVGKLEKQVQALAASTGVAGFQATGRQVRPFTENIKLSPKQTHKKTWLNDDGAGMYMYVSELSPAWLLKNNSTNRYTAFNGTQQWGLGTPTYIAIPTAAGATVLKTSQAITPALLGNMNRSWVLAWFTGANGYADWDAPYLLVLQHRPRAMAMDENGLNIDFATKAGYMAVMPLYGGYKPPQAGKTQFVDAGLAPKDVLPFQWTSQLPKAVIDRCDWWAQVLKAFPVDCDEEFSVDPSADDLVVKSKFDYVMINDDWETKPIKFAPIPYVLGMCVWGKTFPVTFDGKVTDPMLPSCYGPYMGVEGADEYTYRMHVLQYVHEVEDFSGDRSTPAAKAAMAAMARYAAPPAANPSGLERIKEPNLCWGIYNDLRWQNSDLMYLNDAGLTTSAQLVRQRFYNNQLLFHGQYDEWPGKNEPAAGVSRTFLFMSGPGFGFQGDAGKITMDAYYTAWLYGYATGDFQLMADRWDDIVSRLNCLPFTMNWSGVGRGSIAEGGDEGPPPMGFARVAYAVGDMDSYAYGCYLFARELTHHYVKVGVGGDYFRAFQPINPLVNGDWVNPKDWPKAGAIPQRANVTNLWGETAGWVIGGPPDDKAYYSAEIWNGPDPLHGNKPRSSQADVIPWSFYGSGQWVQKWSRFDAEDVFRFYHDYAFEQSKKELDTWLKVEFPGLPDKQYRMSSDRMKQDGYPASPWRLMQLRADILHEPAEQIAALFPPNQWEGADQTFYQAIIRASGERKLARLIPKGPATPFQPGIQRDFVGNPSWGNPVQTPAGIIVEGKDRDKGKKFVHWPTPTYYYAVPRKLPGGTVGTDHRWSFGYITTGAPKPNSASQETINWVTDVYVFE